ncbi:hypothetical protein GF361_02950 [Candidatus Woesearchaeota archaeon]|nr:hypothetical protein [Candidatus Woesearchaeota archaeon]
MNIKSIYMNFNGINIYHVTGFVPLSRVDYFKNPITVFDNRISLDFGDDDYFAEYVFIKTNIIYEPFNKNLETLLFSCIDVLSKDNKTAKDKLVEEIENFDLKVIGGPITTEAVNQVHKGVQNLLKNYIDLDDFQKY